MIMENNRDREERERREQLFRLFEIILIIIGLCIVIFCFAQFTDVFKSFLPNHTVTLSKSDNSTEIYNALAVEVNAINNILTWGSFIVAALTITAAVFGILSIGAFREETRNHIKSSKKEIENIKIVLTKAFNEFAIDQNTRLENHNNTIDNFINDVNSRSVSFEGETNTRLDNFEHDTNARLEDYEAETHTRIDNLTEIIDNYTNRVDLFTTQIDNLREYFSQQARYFDYIIEYLYQVTYANIEHLNDQAQAQQLLNHLYHELQIARLYRTYITADEAPVVNINRIAALEYLEGEGNGTMDDIPHLDYVVEHDPDERIRQRAIEVRAIIRNRNNN